MRKSKILLAGIIAVAVCGMLTACGKEKEEVVEEIKPTMYAKERNLYGNDDDVSEEDTDDKATKQADISEATEDDAESTEETAEQGTADEMTEEKAIELCQRAYDTFSGAEDMMEIAVTCDMDLCYYFETGELVDDIEELTAYTGEFLETDNILIDAMVNSGIAAEDIKWDSATKLSRKKTMEWNKFITEYMKENFEGSPAETYEFEEVWAVDVYEPESESTEETTQSNKIVAGYDFENPMFLVVKRNGEWKTDLLFSMTRQIFNGLTASTTDEMTESEDMESTEETTAESEE